MSMIAGAVGLLISGGPAAASQQTLYSFCGQAGCADGSSPSADLVMDAAGHLYGTTSGGGSHSSGAVFELTRDVSTGRWQRRILHSFCSNGYPCVDGTTPAGKLAIDVNGALYGTAMGGTASDGGTVFSLIPDSSQTRWAFRVLYSFCAKTNCADGKAPASGLTYQGAASGAPYDGTSPLYGTAQSGGAHGQGLVFQLVPSHGNSKQQVKTLYSFCALANCADGAQPWQSLVGDASGNLFGVTYGRGNQPGLIFELQRGQMGWRDVVLHRFCQAANCSDGRAPNALVTDVTGALFGTAYGGGANGQGLMFKLLPRGGNSTYSVLYNFCSQTYCYDGAAPASALTIDTSGNLYGTTYYGGIHQIDRDEQGGGTVFRLSRAGVYRVIRNFCAATDCADGQYPDAGLLMDANGALYGTTQLGGRHGSMFQGGTAFAISLN